MDIQKIPADKLKTAKYNPRKDLKPGDKEYEKLKRSIEKFGYVEPLVWNKRTGNIIGGHQRYKVLVSLGQQEIDCVVVDLDERQEKTLNIALNKISGEWDMPLLSDLLKELGDNGLDTSLTGFDDKEIEKLIAQFNTDEIKEDDFDAAEEAKNIINPITKLGDIWQLGPHRLMCGDATILADVEKLMKGLQTNMFFTDPPYNVNYEGNNGLKIKNDSMPNDKFYQFLYDAFTNMFAVSSAGGAIYVCHSDSEGINFRRALIESGWLMKQCIIWVKNALVIGRQDYQWKHEPILYGWKPGASHNWYGDRKQSTVIEDYASMSIRQESDGAILTFTNGIQVVSLRVPSFEVLLQGNDADTTVWRFDKPLRSKEHPTMKPIGICARAIKNSSKPLDIVADFFGGSGSTLMAAEQTNRMCFTMELDEKYCDVIIKRWEQFTGKKAVLAEGR